MNRAQVNELIAARVAERPQVAGRAPPEDHLEVRRTHEQGIYSLAYQDGGYRMKLWRKEILRDWLNQTQGDQYLDVGCGRGESLVIADTEGFDATGGEVVPALANLCAWTEDPDPALGTLREHGYPVHLLDGAHSLPFDRARFNVVTCLDVLEHVLEEDILPALREIWRVTSAEGHILLGVSQKPQDLHPTIYSDGEWTDLIVEATGVAPVFVYSNWTPKIKKPYAWMQLVKL